MFQLKNFHKLQISHSHVWPRSRGRTAAHLSSSSLSASWPERPGPPPRPEQPGSPGRCPPCNGCWLSPQCPRCGPGHWWRSENQSPDERENSGSVSAVSTDTGWAFFRTWLSQEICGILVTFTGSPSLGMVMFLGILQVISLSRTLASQFTPAIVMTMVMQELTRFSFWCWERRGEHYHF